MDNYQIKLPKGFILDEPEESGLPDGFIADQQEELPDGFVYDDQPQIKRTPIEPPEKPGLGYVVGETLKGAVGDIGKTLSPIGKWIKGVQQEAQLPLEEKVRPLAKPKAWVSTLGKNVTKSVGEMKELARTILPQYTDFSEEEWNRVPKEEVKQSFIDTLKEGGETLLHLGVWGPKNIIELAANPVKYIRDHPVEAVMLGHMGMSGLKAGTRPAKPKPPKYEGPFKELPKKPELPKEVKSGKMTDIEFEKMQAGRELEHKATLKRIGAQKKPVVDDYGYAAGKIAGKQEVLTGKPIEIPEIPGKKIMDKVKRYEDTLPIKEKIGRGEGSAVNDARKYKSSSDFTNSVLKKSDQTRLYQDIRQLAREVKDINSVNEAVLNRFGTDPDITLYRGISKELKPSPFDSDVTSQAGRFWTPQRAHAEQFTRGIGRMNRVVIKASDLLKSRLSKESSLAENQVILSGKLQVNLDTVPTRVELTKIWDKSQIEKTGAKPEKIGREPKVKLKKITGAVEPSGLDKSLAELSKKLEPDIPKVGLGIKKVSYQKGIKFTDPEMEATWRKAKGIKKKPLIGRVRDTMRKLGHQASRTYEYLPNTAETVNVKTALKTFEKQSSVSFNKALEITDKVTRKLSKPEYDAFTKKLVLEDFKASVEKGEALPFGWTMEQVHRELPKIDAHISTNPGIQAAVKSRTQLFGAVREELIGKAKELGLDLDKRFTRKNYFRRMVMEEFNARGGVGIGKKKLETPTTSGYMRRRKGSSLPINVDYLEVETEVLSKMIYDTKKMEALLRVGKDSIHKDIRLKAKSMGLEDWHEAIPDTHAVFQPKEGFTYYTASTLPEKMLTGILEMKVEDMGAVKGAIRKARAIGGKRREWVLRKEVVKTLDDWANVREPEWLSKLNKQAIRKWKQWQLMSPRRWFKYNFRNQSGDMDAVFVGNPSGFLEAPKATGELWDVMAAKKSPTPELRGWIERGGLESTLQAQEIGHIKSSGHFKRLYNEQKVDLNIWKRYWQAARGTTDFRESVLRYANYKKYLKDIKKSGKPKNYGASIPEEVDMLIKGGHIEDAAFRLSNELLGAYDEISVIGAKLRENALPFWSWKELNARRYFRFAKNAFYDKKITKGVGETLLKGVKHTPFVAWKVGRLAVKMYTFWGLLEVYNNLVHPGVEADLPEKEKASAHINLGRDKDGKVIYFRKVGALSDMLEWIGMDAPASVVQDLMRGRKSLKEVATDMAKGPVNVVGQSLHPIKGAFEVATRQSLYPDVFDPKAIRDRGRYIARQFGLENEYAAIKGAIDKTPSEPYKKSLPEAFIYKSDPLENAYHEIYDLKRDWQKKHKIGGTGFWISPRGQALYNLKLAMRHGGKEDEKRYVQEYINIAAISGAAKGKTVKELRKSIERGIMESIKRMHPLDGMTPTEAKGFIDTLDEDERDLLVRSIKFFNDILIGNTPIDKDNIKLK